MNERASRSCSSSPTKKVSRYGRKITPKKKFGSSSDENMETEIKSHITKDSTMVSEDLPDDAVFANSMIKSDTKGKENVVPKTPYSLRQRLKSKIQVEVEKEEDVFSLSGESEWEESDEDSSSSSQEEEESNAVSLPTPSKSLRSDTFNNRTSFYAYSSSDYLEKCGKSNTSAHRLKTLDGGEHFTSLLSSYVPSHSSHISSLSNHYQSLFYRWMYAFSKGFSVLVYGLGSKKSLLTHFQNLYLPSCNVLVINGFFPGLTIKDIVSSLFELLNVKIKETIDALFQVLDRPKTPRIFLIVNNIDGVALRIDTMQSFLSRLAAHCRVHLLASADHVNAPLMWDHKKISRFNFMWENCSTYLPYSVENNFESSFLSGSSTSMALSSLRNVYRALNKNSRSIFKLILDHSLDSTNKNNGMLFSELYLQCRKNFIVSSDLALRTQLTEFIDHQIVKWKKENVSLTVCVEREVLKMFNSEIDNFN